MPDNFLMNKLGPIYMDNMLKVKSTKAKLKSWLLVKSKKCLAYLKIIINIVYKHGHLSVTVGYKRTKSVTTPSPLNLIKELYIPKNKKALAEKLVQNAIFTA